MFKAILKAVCITALGLAATSCTPAVQNTMQNINTSVIQTVNNGPEASYLVNAQTQKAQGWKTIVPYWVENDSVYFFDGRNYSSTFEGRHDYYAGSVCKLDLATGKFSQIPQDEAKSIIEKEKNRVQVLDMTDLSAGDYATMVGIGMTGGETPLTKFDGRKYDKNEKNYVTVKGGVRLKLQGGFSKDAFRKGTIYITNQKGEKITWSTGWHSNKLPTFYTMAGKEYFPSILEEMHISNDQKHLLVHGQLYRFGNETPVTLFEGCLNCAVTVSPSWDKIGVMRYSKGDFFISDFEIYPLKLDQLPQGYK